MGLLHVAKMPAANVVAAFTSILILLWTINIVNAAREYKTFSLYIINFIQFFFLFFKIHLEKKGL